MIKKKSKGNNIDIERLRYWKYASAKEKLEWLEKELIARKGKSLKNQS